MLETLMVSMAFISVVVVAVAVVLIGIAIVKESDKDLPVITIGLSIVSMGALILVATINELILL